LAPSKNNPVLLPAGKIHGDFAVFQAVESPRCAVAFEQRRDFSVFLGALVGKPLFLAIVEMRGCPVIGSSSLCDGCRPPIDADPPAYLSHCDDGPSTKKTAKLAPGCRRDGKPTLHGLWPCSAMQVVYVYHGMVLELYSLALPKARTEHLWIAAARAALTLSPAARA
jgi:hypothetical protein